MKKTLSIIISILCIAIFLASGAAAEEDSWICPNCGEKQTSLFCQNDGTKKLSADTPWPVRTLNGIESSLKFLQDEDDRYQSYFGPSKSYPEAGAYKPHKVNKLTELFREGDFVLVDMDYQTAGKRCVYFKASALNNGGSVESETLTTYPAVTTALLIPKCGPGMEYENVEQKKESKYADWSLEDLFDVLGAGVLDAIQPTRNSVYLEPETNLDVFFETDGWIFAEFTCEMGLVRAWIPTEYVDAR